MLPKYSWLVSGLIVFVLIFAPLSAQSSSAAGLVSPPLKFYQVPEQSVTLGQTLSFTIDTNLGQKLAYSAVYLPPQASFDPVGHVFTWTTTKETIPGSYLAMFHVSNGLEFDDMPVFIKVLSPAGSLLDRFETPQGWDKNDPGRKGSAKLVNGQLVLQQKRKNASYTALAPNWWNTINTNYILETKLAVDAALANQDPNLFYGLVFDYKNGSRYYRFWVQPGTQTWRLEGYQGRWKLVAKGASDTIKNLPGEWNMLRLERTFDPVLKKVLVSAWINGAKVVDGQAISTTAKAQRTGLILHADAKLPGGKTNWKMAQVLAEYFIKEETANHTPNTPAALSLVSGEKNQRVSPSLVWSGGDPDDEQIVYDVYLGKDNPPTSKVSQGQTAVSFSAQSIEPDQTYYWQILARDGHGAEARGPVWQFGTSRAPNAPVNLGPVNGAVNQYLTPTMNWTGGADPDGDRVSYDVYFGLDNPPSTRVSAKQVMQSYLSAKLDPSKTYYWQVLAIDEYDATTPGPVWQFDTTRPPNSPASLFPELTQTLAPNLRWSASDPDGDNLTYDVYFGESNPPTSKLAADQSASNYKLNGLTDGASYYWKVVARDIHGVETPSPVWPLAIENMLPVAAGDFAMGCDPAHTAGVSCPYDAVPLHTVNLDAYQMDKNEVTNAFYAQCVADGVCSPPLFNTSLTRTDYYNNPVYANYPVIWVHWENAETYCTWAGKHLPSEAQWEKAAHGPTSRAYPWGDEPPTCTLANYFDVSGGCVGDTNAVGSYPAGASPYGLMDMAGNVEEWVNDLYQWDYYSTSPYKNPPGPSENPYAPRVVRGLNWTLSTFIRIETNWHVRHDTRGFRCAANP